MIIVSEISFYNEDTKKVVSLLKVEGLKEDNPKHYVALPFSKVLYKFPEGTSKDRWTILRDLFKYRFGHTTKGKWSWIIKTKEVIDYFENLNTSELSHEVRKNRLGRKKRKSNRVLSDLVSMGREDLIPYAEDMLDVSVRLESRIANLFRSSLPESDKRLVTSLIGGLGEKLISLASPEKCVSLGCSITKVVKYRAEQDIMKSSKVTKRIYEIFRVNTRRKKGEVKDMIQGVYDQCGVVIKKAKSSDIGMWFEFKEIGGDIKILDRL